MLKRLLEKLEALFFQYSLIGSLSEIIFITMLLMVTVVAMLAFSFYIVLTIGSRGLK